MFPMLHLHKRPEVKQAVVTDSKSNQVLADWWKFCLSKTKEANHQLSSTSIDPAMV